MMPLLEADTLISLALREDIGDGDITTSSIIQGAMGSAARLIAQQRLVVAGLDVVQRVFEKLDPEVKVRKHRTDGDAVAAGEVVLAIEGSAAALLAGERREDLVSCGGQDGGDSGDEVAVVVYHQYPKPFLRHCLPRKRERAGPRHCSPAPAQVLSAGVVSGISQACLSQSRGR